MLFRSPVGLFATLSYVIDVHPSLPVKSLKDLLALARAKPGAINYGSAGQGSSTHLAIEHFAQMGGVRMTHIPYKGNTPAMTAPPARGRTFFALPLRMVAPAETCPSPASTTRPPLRTHRIVVDRILFFMRKQPV